MITEDFTLFSIFAFSVAMLYPAETLISALKRLFLGKKFKE